MRDETIWDVLNRELFFVRDAVKVSEPKLGDKFDVYDPAQRVMTMQVREPNIGKMTQAARLCGGGHDRGAAFDLVANIPNSAQQTLRVSGKSPMFGLNGRRVDICDHRGSLVAGLKKIVLALGLKFSLTETATRDQTVLEVKPSLLKGNLEVFVDQKRVAVMKRAWDGAHADFFEAEGFDYAVWISPEVKNNTLRQALVALGLAHHRVAM